LIRNDPKITLAEISEKIDKSHRTVKITMKSLQDKGVIERHGSKKSGSWKIH
jgi:ATP-dependent DNA helicase RecG